MTSFPLKGCAVLLSLVLPGRGWAEIELPATTEGPVIQSAPEIAPSPFREGEDLKFVIKWGLVTGGYSTLKIKTMENVDGRPTYHIVSEARSTGMVNTLYHVNDRNETWIEPNTPSTLKYARNIHEGKYRLKEEVLLDQKTHRFYQTSYRADKDRHESKEGDIPANVLDILGSFYYVRTLPLEVGKTFTIDVHSGDKVYPLIVKVKKRQMVRVKAGKFDCFLVEPELREPGIFVSKGKKLEVFLTADARRMPVLMRSEIFIGHVNAELVSHRTVPTETMALTQAQKPELNPSSEVD